MARYGRRRTSWGGRPAVAMASEADRQVAKQVVVAQIDDPYPSFDSRVFTIIGNTPSRGEIAAFYLDVVRSKPRVTVVLMPPGTRSDLFVSTDERVELGEDAIPVIQFRRLVFYRRIDKLRDWLEQAAPTDESEMLHFLALFERKVQLEIQKRRLTITDQREAQWRRYGACRELYLKPGTDGEKQAAGHAVVKIARAFLSATLNGKG